MKIPFFEGGEKPPLVLKGLKLKIGWQKFPACFKQHNQFLPFSLLYATAIISSFVLLFCTLIYVIVLYEDFVNDAIEKMAKFNNIYLKTLCILKKMHYILYSLQWIRYILCYTLVVFLKDAILVGHQEFFALFM